MPLPILHTTTGRTDDDLVRLFHRTELHWTQHLGEEAALDAGTAFTNPELPRVWNANRVLDAALPDHTEPAAAVAEIEEHFRARGTRCWQWVLNPAAPAARTRALADHLSSSGWTASSSDILHLGDRPAGRLEEVGGLTIIPARASFRHARALAEEAAAMWNEPQVADARLLHIDDPHVDALLALKGQVAVGSIDVLAVGEIGRIDDVFVPEAFRGQGIGRTLLSRALEICARSLFKHVMLSVGPTNEPAQSLYARVGFRKAGQITAYQAVEQGGEPAGRAS